MIYTVTINPSLDYIVSVPRFRMNVTNRTMEESMVAGGKGINVSKMLKNLGIESVAIGFRAGFIGEEICRQISEMGLRADWIPVERGNNRVNVKLKNYAGTEINGGGPEVQEKELLQLLEKLDALQTGDVLILAGSMPNSLPLDTYKRIMRMVSPKEIKVVVDATGEQLLNVLGQRPFLVKPNEYELGELFGVNLEDREQIIEYARKVQELGARNVLVSRAQKGAILLAEDGSLFESPALKGVLVNGVGAGDAMVAGFMAGWTENEDYQEAFRMGVAAGCASAYSEGFPSKDEVWKLLQQF